MKQVDDKTFYSEIRAGICVVDFMADWCQPCKSVGKTLEDLEQKYKQIKFLRVNVEESPRVTGDCNISNLPTVMFFVRGNCQEMILIGTKATPSAIKNALALYAATG